MPSNEHQKWLKKSDLARGSYKNACKEIVKVLRLTPNVEDVLNAHGAKPATSAPPRKAAWKKHKKTCKAALTSPPATEADLRVSTRGCTSKNLCIQENGAGDGLTSVVVGFLVRGLE